MEPITRAEQIMSGESLEPITREEMFLAKAAGMDVETPAPITRREMFLSKISGGGGGTPVNNQDKTITQNGTYTADEGYTGLGNVTVNVASSGGSDDGSFKAVIERTATEITLPSDLTKIGNYAFYEYRTLNKVSLPAGLTSIYSNAFCNCDNLALTSLPSCITSIGSNAFRSCNNIAEITFNSKPIIDSSAFKNCNNLHTINVPWAEGEVANAPWGATNATINYNYTGG